MGKTPKWLGAALVCGTVGCVSAPEPAPATGAPERHPTPTEARFYSLSPATLLPAGDAQRKIEAAVESHFARTATRRGYIMTDKPLYQPGETIWFRADLRATAHARRRARRRRDRAARHRRAARSSRQKRVLAHGRRRRRTTSSSPPRLEGGEYTLQLTTDDGTARRAQDRRQHLRGAAPARRRVEFVRKAYGAGRHGRGGRSRSSARPASRSPTSRSPASSPSTTSRSRASPIKTDGEGKATAQFTLPGDDRARRRPAHGARRRRRRDRVDPEAHPDRAEDAQRLALPRGRRSRRGRCPAASTSPPKNTLGKPADVEGSVVDDRGAGGRDVHVGPRRHGRASSSRRPPDRTLPRRDHQAGGHRADVRRARRPSPAAASLRSVDDARPDDELRVAAICTDARTRARRGHAAREAARRRRRRRRGRQAGAASSCPSSRPRRARCASRCSRRRQKPLAERLVYHGRGQDLKVTITADRKTLLAARSGDAHRQDDRPDRQAGRRPNVGLAVVDDTVLVVRRRQERAHPRAPLPRARARRDRADPVEEPNFYFSDKPEAAAAMDALLATRG